MDTLLHDLQFLGADAPPAMPLDLHRPRIHVIDVIRAASALSREPVEQITGPSRCQPLARWRQRAMYVARSVTEASYPRIARAFGRDHTTVLFAFRKLAAVCASDDGELQACRQIASLAAQLAERATWRRQAELLQ